MNEAIWPMPWWPALLGVPKSTVGNDASRGCMSPFAPQSAGCTAAGMPPLAANHARQARCVSLSLSRRRGDMKQTLRNSAVARPARARCYGPRRAGGGCWVGGHVGGCALLGALAVWVYQHARRGRVPACDRLHPCRLRCVRVSPMRDQPCHDVWHDDMAEPWPAVSGQQSQPAKLQ